MTFRTSNSIADLYSAYNILESLTNYYPNFKDWYWNKVVPGILTGEDKIIIAEKRNDLVGISLIKDNFNSEKKLRAVRILPKYQNKGVGLYLIDKSLEMLNCDKPMVSVSEELFHDYSRMFVERYNFELSHVYKGMYRKGKLEYTFNEHVPLKIKTNY